MILMIRAENKYVDLTDWREHLWVYREGIGRPVNEAYPVKVTWACGDDLRARQEHF